MSLNPHRTLFCVYILAILIVLMDVFIWRI
jgi:hypothetical protein